MNRRGFLSALAGAPAAFLVSKYGAPSLFVQREIRYNHCAVVSSKGADQILRDINAMICLIDEETEGAEIPTRVLLPQGLERRLMLREPLT